MKNYELRWNKILKDLDNDDIVLEIKILNTNIQDWNKIVNVVYKKFSSIIEYNNISTREHLDLNNFSKTENDIMEYLVLNFEDFTLTLTLYSIDQIELFSNSVVRLKANNLEQLFLFAEDISNEIQKNIYIYCEGYKEFSVYYNNKSWSDR